MDLNGDFKTDGIASKKIEGEESKKFSGSLVPSPNPGVPMDPYPAYLILFTFGDSEV